MAKIKKINIGTAEYDICDAAATAKIEVLETSTVQSINGYSAAEINAATDTTGPTFANTKILNAEIDEAVANIGTSN